MIRDITLGQYYQADSVIHKLDPRVKLVATIGFIISLFVVNSWVGYVVAALFLACMIKLSKVPFRYMVKGMKAIVFILMITVVFNLFLTPGEPLIAFWKLTITQEGLRIAVMILLEETDKIMKAQIARGADFESGNLIKKAKAMVPLLVPLFISAFRRANDLAMAMEARCYRGGEHRTKMKPLRYCSADRVAYGVLLVYFAGCVAIRVWL